MPTMLTSPQFIRYRGKPGQDLASDIIGCLTLVEAEVTTIVLQHKQPNTDQSQERQETKANQPNTAHHTQPINRGDEKD